jgi:hypothetical protein
MTDPGPLYINFAEEGLPEPRPPSIPEPGATFAVEFAGTPRSGKTTALNSLAERLAALGHTVAIIAEKASARQHTIVTPDLEVRLSAPADKGNPSFSEWTVGTTFTEVLGILANSPPDYLLIDRGEFDYACWMEAWQKAGKIRQNEAMWPRVRIDSVRRLFPQVGPHLVLALVCSPETAIRREWGNTIPPKLGPIINFDFLAAFNRAILTAVYQYSDRFPALVIPTDELGPVKLLDMIEYLLLENEGFQRSYWQRRRELDGKERGSIPLADPGLGGPYDLGF